MFSQQPDDDNNKNLQLQNNPRRRKSKWSKNKKKRKGNKKKAASAANAAIKKQTPQSSIATITMSSWAESFTHAATWQMKHQIAYWKSKATALEYENRILHDIIRKNYMNSDGSVDNSTDQEDITEQLVEESESSDEEPENNDNFEVSEEYIQFLMSNAKFKEDAKKERERIKALQNSEQKIIEELEAMPTRNVEEKEESFKKLYGENWQRLAALETSVQSQFLSDCDLAKPEYWPNIPLNFNFG